MPSPPTESWFAIRIKGSFATQSGVERASFRNAPTDDEIIGWLQRRAQRKCARAVMPHSNPGGD
jgi:hypothetical protein